MYYYYLPLKTVHVFGNVTWLKNICHESFIYQFQGYVKSIIVVCSHQKISARECITYILTYLSVSIVSILYIPRYLITKSAYMNFH